MSKESWKVGEISKLTGLTVRTLHHYDQIGILIPSKDESGHRFYTSADLAVLQQIVSLRNLGFTLDEINELLTSPNFSPQEVIRMHLEKLQEHIKIQEKLYLNLSALQTALKGQEQVSGENFIQLIEIIVMSERTQLTLEEIDRIKTQGELLDQAQIREVEKEWPELIAQVRTVMEKGTPPTDPEALKLARRWQHLVEVLTGGDHLMLQKLQQSLGENPDVMAQAGFDPKVFAYIAKAMPVQ